MATALKTETTSRKFVILPFRRKGKSLLPGEMRQASSAASAERVAGSMAARFAGVAAYEVTVEHESGDMRDPVLICRHGETIDLTQDD